MSDHRPPSGLEVLRRLDAEMGTNAAQWVKEVARAVRAARTVRRSDFALCPSRPEEPDMSTPDAPTSQHWSSVTPDGARAAQAFADRYVDRHRRSPEDTDPRTEVDAHWGGDPERIVSAWENDRAELRAALARAHRLAEGAPMDDG